MFPNVEKVPSVSIPGETFPLMKVSSHDFLIFSNEEKMPFLISGNFSIGEKFHISTGGFFPELKKFCFRFGGIFSIVEKFHVATEEKRIFSEAENSPKERMFMSFFFFLKKSTRSCWLC